MLHDVNGHIPKPGDRIRILCTIFEVYFDDDTKLLMIKQLCPSYIEPLVMPLYEKNRQFEIITDWD